MRGEGGGQQERGEEEKGGRGGSRESSPVSTKPQRLHKRPDAPSTVHIHTTRKGKFFTQLHAGEECGLLV